MQATLKEKLSHEMEDYLVLGACNPLAHRAIEADRSIGLLLPCKEPRPPWHGAVLCLAVQLLRSVWAGSGFGAALSAFRGRSVGRAFLGGDDDGGEESEGEGGSGEGEEGVAGCGDDDPGGHAAGGSGDGDGDVDRALGLGSCGQGDGVGDDGGAADEAEVPADAEQTANSSSTRSPPPESAPSR
ncbi:hypothetical protein GCM10010449_05720 [Streptomyces rectiviolaceus]|uniref:DUF302 domain-containing protein n=1 Tax=Streptomyces rectiviolaceus TaxID=332591 RepID=A0ABP6M8W8_9ACTN